MMHHEKSPEKPPYNMTTTPPPPFSLLKGETGGFRTMNTVENHLIRDQKHSVIVICCC